MPWHMLRGRMLLGRLLSGHVFSQMSVRTRTIILLTLSFVGIFTFVIGFKLVRDRQDALLLAEAQASASAGALTAQFRATLVSVESLLDYAALALTTRSDDGAPLSPDVTQVLIDRLDQVRAVHNLVIIDADGQALFDPGGLEFQKPDLAAEPYFTYHRNTPAPGLFVTSGPQFLLSKRIQNQDGAFAGVAVAILARDHLQHLARSASLSQSTRLILIDREGTVLSADPPLSPTQSTRISGLLGLIWPAPDDYATRLLTYTRTGEGERVLLAGRPLPGTPFTLILARPLDDILQAWRHSLFFYALIILGPSLFGAGVGGILTRQMERRLAADRARKASEARLDLAVAAAKCGIWDWDLDRNRLYWSPSMYAMLGRTPGPKTLSPSDILGWIHPNERGVLAEMAVEAECSGEGYDTHFRLRHAHGHWIWVHAKGRLLGHDEEGTDGAGKRLVGIVVDVSERYEAEARIAEAERRLRDAIDSLSESFVLWDKNDRLVLFNKRFVEFYAIPPETLKPGMPREDVFKLAGADIDVLVHEKLGTTGEQDADQNAALDTSDRHENVESGESGFTEIQFCGSRWIHASTQTTGDGGRVTVGTDITPLKEQEEELLRSETRLKALVAQLQHSQEELRKEAVDRAELAVKYAAEKARAEEANRSKTEFLANMSHELRTPLNAIMGFAQVMQQGLFGPLSDPRYEEYTEHILESGQYLLDLISDILDMSKIESGKLALELDKAQVERVLEDCLKIIEPRAFEEGLQLENALPPLPEIDADTRAIKQVLLNLLSNAVKFTPRGGCITIDGEARDDYIVINVKDTGIGIAEKDLRRIARPFEQIEPQHTKMRGGSGLGLALSKSLVELHGGTLTVHSKVGVGTTVRLTLPRRVQTEAPIKDVEAAPEQPAPAKPPLDEPQTKGPAQETVPGPARHPGQSAEL